MAKHPRLVKKLNRAQAGRWKSVEGCWDGGYQSEFVRLMQRGIRSPVAALELLTGAARAWIVATRIRRLIELL